ncbi:hypothetical protein G7Y79_00017g041830 [Physcia stellaris]|nr:hypothetical protein G7Y79_00017g041830 [Physcia stellaris]
MSQSRQQASALKRSTSSGKTRIPGQPATRSKLLSITGSILPPSARHADWTAEVAKVQRCSSSEYNGGEGYKVLFEYSDKSLQRCTLVAAGNIEGLTLRLELGAKHKDPSPIVLYTFNITNDENIYTIRLFDYRMSMDLHVDPRRGARGRAKPIGDFWVIYFRGHVEQEIKNAKAMLRRVESITLEMPDKWFKCATSAADETPESSQTSATEAAYSEELPGGYNVRWTATLASPLFLRAMGHLNIRPARQQSPETAEVQDEAYTSKAAAGEARVTRATAKKLKKQGAFRHSSLPLRSKVVENPTTKKQKRAAKKARRELVRRNKRAMLLDAESLSEEGDDEGQSPSTVNNSREVVESSLSPDGSSEDSDKSSSSRRWELERIIDDDVVDGVHKYLVKWIGAWEDTWEPRENIDESAIHDYEQKKAQSQRRGRGGSRGAKRGRVFNIWRPRIFEIFLNDFSVMPGLMGVRRSPCDAFAGNSTYWSLPLGPG